MWAGLSLCLAVLLPRGGGGVVGTRKLIALQCMQCMLDTSTVLEISVTSLV